MCSTRVIATLLPLGGYIGSASPPRAAKRDQGLLTLTGKNRPIISLGGVDRIELERLYYASADNKYVTLVHDQGETLCDYSLRDLEQAHGEQLLRIHRHSLVNRRYLKALTRTQSGHQAQLSDPSGTRLRVSRRHAATVRDYLEG